MTHCAIPNPRSTGKNGGARLHLTFLFTTGPTCILHLFRFRKMNKIFQEKFYQKFTEFPTTFRSLDPKKKVPVVTANFAVALLNLV